MASFVNFLLYQTGWFACVLGAAWQLQWPGMWVAVALICVHLVLAADRAMQARLMVFAGVMGLALDSALLHSGVFEFPEGQSVRWMPPPFMTILWLQFATTLRYCLGWLSGRYALSACVGLVGAPLAFAAGERLGAIVFLPPRSWHFAVLGCAWAVVVPLLVLVADRGAARYEPNAAYPWLEGKRPYPPV